MERYKHYKRIVEEIHPKHYPKLLALYMNDNTNREMDIIINSLNKEGK